MLKHIIVIFVLIVQVSISAQNYKFGKVSKEELKEEFYPTDSTAEAAYLYSYRRTYFDYNKNKGFRLVTEVKERIKIYSKEGYDKATKKINYYKPDSGDNEKISSLKGYTFNLTNNKVDKQKLTKSSIFDEKISKYRSVKKVVFPNVKEGTILDLEYTLESPYDRVVDDVRYQFDIPVKSLFIEIKTPEYYTFKKKGKGYYSIPVKSTKENGQISFSQRVRTDTRSFSGGATRTSEVVNSVVDLQYNIDVYEANNIPALNDKEPFVTDIKNYRGGVKYELESTKYPDSPLKFYSTSWEKVSEQIYKTPGFGGELKKTGYFEDDLQNILKTATSDYGKAVAILEFVKKKIKWNNYLGKYTEKGVKKAYKEGTGNIADINLVLTAMLQAAGLNANPVLVSTRKNGIPLFPTLEGFNYVLSTVQFPENKYLLLDATAPYTAPNILPRRALNWNGRVVTSNGTSAWIRLTPTKHAEEDNIVMVKVTDDLTLEGVSRTKFVNLSALDFRNKYNRAKEEYLTTNFEENNSVEVDNLKISNSYKLDAPITRSIKFKSEDLIEEINGKIYIEPLLFLTHRENPFKLKERKYPVDFASPLKFKNSVSVQIPEGYEIVSVPETLAIGLPDKLGFFKYQILKAGNKIKTISVLQINAPIITPQYYTALKDFYDKMVQKESEKIILTKI